MHCEYKIEFSLYDWYSWGQVLIFELLCGNLDLLLFSTASSLFTAEESNSQDTTNSSRIFKDQDLTPCYAFLTQNLLQGYEAVLEHSRSGCA